MVLVLMGRGNTTRMTFWLSKSLREMEEELENTNA